MRADRLLSIMLLLQVRRRMTSRELAERLEVSERTIHRDMESLSAAGVPVIAVRGAGGGWTLPEGYQTNLTGLNQDEIKALFLTGPSRLLSDLGLHDAAEGASIKLLAALPSAHRRDASFIRQRIHLDAAGWSQPEERSSALPVLQDALWRDRRAYLTYQRDGGENVERLVDPLGLVAKGSIWYLLAAVEGEIRTYRVSRVRSARVADEPCRRPEDFDLAAHWAQASRDFIANLPRYPARVRVAPEIIPRLRLAGRFARVESVGPPAVDGWSEAEIRFETLEEAREYVLGFGGHIEVLEPAELRQVVIQEALAVLQFYAGKNSR